MPEESHPSFWSQLVKDKFMIWVFRILGIAAIIYACIVIYRGLNGDAVNVLGISVTPKEKDTISTIKYVHDTINAGKHDTIIITKKELPPVYNNSKNPQPNSMKIDSGGSGIQNNAPNYGNQAGRDLYENEKTLSQADVDEATNEVISAMRAFNLSEIEFMMCNGNNGGKVLLQIQDALIKKGVNVDKRYQGMTFQSCNGISFDTSMHRINIYIGRFN